MARTTALVVGDPFQMHSGGPSTQDCVCVRERKSVRVFGDSTGSPAPWAVCVCAWGQQSRDTPLTSQSGWMEEPAVHRAPVSTAAQP